MNRRALSIILAATMSLVLVDASAEAQQVTVYDNFGAGHGGFDYNWGLGWTVAGVSVPAQYGVEQAMAFQATESGVVSDIWVATWYVPLDAGADLVTFHLARNPNGQPPAPQDVMEEWTLTTFGSWSQWNPPHHLVGNGQSYLEKGKSYWLWATAGPTTWCGWCMNEDPKLTAPHAMRREGESWLPISNETASAFRVDVRVDFGLAADQYTLPESSGGAIDFHLGAGAPNAFRNYYLLGCASGTTPGLPLPGGAATLPLNPDPLFTIIFDYANTPPLAGFAGTLDSQGRASATLDTLGPLPAGTVGIPMWFAYFLYYPFDYASGPVKITIVP